jgi:hypothetical protein
MYDNYDAWKQATPPENKMHLSFGPEKEKVVNPAYEEYMRKQRELRETKKSK